MTFTEDFRTGIVEVGAGIGQNPRPKPQKARLKMGHPTLLGITKQKESGMANGSGDMTRKNNSKWITDCKERGEWAELCFMALAKGLGLGVLKPFGESGRYEVAVENEFRSGGCR